MNITRNLKSYGAVAVAGAVIISGAGIASATTHVTRTVTKTVTVHVNETITLTQDAKKPSNGKSCKLSAIQTAGPATLSLGTPVHGAYTTSASRAGDYTVNVVCVRALSQNSATPSPNVSPNTHRSPAAGNYKLTTVWTIHVIGGDSSAYTYTVSIIGWAPATRSRAADLKVAKARSAAVRSYLRSRGMTSARIAAGGKRSPRSDAKGRAARIVIVWHGPTSGSAMTWVYFAPGSTKLSRSAKLRLRALYAGLPRA